MVDPVTLAILGGTAAFGGITSAISANRQNNANWELAKYQNEWNREQWNLQNEYNTPKATMQRLTEAGINPRAYAQVGQFANASTPATAAASTYDDPLGKFSAVFQQVAPIVQMASQIEVADSQIGLNNAKAAEALAGKDLKEKDSLIDYEKHELWRWVNGYHTKNGKTAFATKYGYQRDYDDAIIQDIKARYGLNLTKNSIEKLNLESLQRDKEFLLTGQTGQFMQSVVGRVLEYLLKTIFK